MNDVLHVFRKTVGRSVLAEFRPKLGIWRRKRGADAKTGTVTRATELLMDALPEYGECSERIANEAMIVEQLSRAEVRSFSFSQSGAAHHVILAHGSEEQKHNWRPRITARELVATFSIAETGGGPGLLVLKTFASRDGNEYLMNLEQLTVRVVKEPLVSAHK